MFQVCYYYSKINYFKWSWLYSFPGLLSFFQVNGEDLAEITGGEVAITNLHSKGQVYSFQIRFTLTGGKRKGKNPSSDQDVSY